MYKSKYRRHSQLREQPQYADKKETEITSKDVVFVPPDTLQIPPDVAYCTQATIRKLVHMP